MDRTNPLSDRRVIAVGFALLFILIPARSRAAAAPSGEEIYKSHCAACHEQPGATRAPSRTVLQKMPSSRILRTLDFGLMMGVAYPLNREEREAVAKYLGTNEVEMPLPASAYCAADKKPLAGPAAANWNGWSPTSSNARFQTAEQAGMTAAQLSHLKLKWAFGFPQDVTAFAAPTIVKGTVFVGSAAGTVQAIDAQTGCVRWLFQANGPVRAALVAIPRGDGYLLAFGDQIGWGYALDAKSGHLLWRRRLDDHEATRITGSPAVLNGVLYFPISSWEETRSTDPHYECCTFRGSIVALRAKDGSPVWKTYLVDPPHKTGVNKVGTTRLGPSGVAVWSTPTVDVKRGALYITTGDNYSAPATKTSDAVIALDLKTGKIRWIQQTYPNDAYTSACRTKGPNCPDEDGPDYDFGASAILTHTAQGRDILLAGQKSGVVFGIDPDQGGKIVWQTRVGKGGRNGGVQWGMVTDGSAVYAAVSDMGSTLTFDGPVGNAKFDPAVGGGLTALRIDDGSKIWFAQPKPCEAGRPGCSPAQSAALTMIPGVIFSGSVDGHLRAYAAEDGKVLWDFDTATDFSAVDGVKASGGSIDGAGPVIAGGMLFVNSGYPRTGGMPGNVLLAFGVE